MCAEERCHPTSRGKTHSRPVISDDIGKKPKFNKDEIPSVKLCSVDLIEKTIEDLNHKYPNIVVQLLKYDVRNVPRHLRLAAGVSRWFAGTIAEDNVAIIDFSLVFGWTGSPGYYGIFGRVIFHLVQRDSSSSMDPSSHDTEPLFGFEYVDDHVQVEIDHDNRLELAEHTLRISIVSILGPSSINEAKFSPWTMTLVALGLEWNTLAPAKVLKTTLRIGELVHIGHTTKHQLCKLLGSLRQTYCGTDLSSDKLDYVMFLCEFSGLPIGLVHLYMNASKTGLSVLRPARWAYLRVLFDDKERKMNQACKTTRKRGTRNFTINVRELLSAILALLCWAMNDPKLEART
ncbi:hypothetical protein PHMEG_00017672 [Phytophthora megakarya]|uniref:Reverse transcriptase n=1 Tax=Phytophthora megakarya TaxID=4795 RepID=A0A225VXA3_9STRA|nr:hypothetical protein PHMEG_00017672 [Phytophthora megakarya]